MRRLEEEAAGEPGPRRGEIAGPTGLVASVAPGTGAGESVGDVGFRGHSKSWDLSGVASVFSVKEGPWSPVRIDERLEDPRRFEGGFTG